MCLLLVEDDGTFGPSSAAGAHRVFWFGWQRTVPRGRHFAADLARRRTVRQFSDRPVPRAVIDACLEAAGTAPSGAHLQPWHFVVVSDPGLKRRIREAVEEAEREFYAHAPQEWLDALAPLGTDAHKLYLDTAPYLIAVFAERYGVTAEGRRQTHRYPAPGALVPRLRRKPLDAIATFR